MKVKDFYTKIEEKVKSSNLRRGQAVFNLLQELDQDFAESIRSTKCDPFHNDKLINRCIESAVQSGVITR